MVTAISANHLKYKINAKDHNPPHVHVEGLGSSIRVNLLTIEPMDAQTGFSPRLVRQILDVVNENRLLLMDQWEMLHGQD